MNAELAMDVADQAYKSRTTNNGMSSRPSASTGHAVVDEINDALESGRLDLPTLPDMAIKIQNSIDDPNVSADKIVSLLSSDLAISMYIIKTANSAALSNATPVSNLRNAISRLGYRMLRSIVMNITMNKLFQARSPLVSKQMKALWKHSREVAAISYVLAQQQRHLKPDQAMLAGLVHDIGALPLYLYADRHHAHIDQTTLEELVLKFSGAIGAKLLQSWNFPDELIDVVAGHENLQRASSSNLADYVDVVTMANLQMPDTAKYVAWQNVKAAERLGYTTTDCVNFLPNHADQLAAVKSMLEFGS